MHAGTDAHGKFCAVMLRVTPVDLFSKNSLGTRSVLVKYWAWITRKHLTGDPGSPEAQQFGKRLFRGGVLTRQVALLRLKIRQARREERGLVTPNEQRTTQHGAFSGTTRRAGPVFPPSGVIIRLSRPTTLRSFCIARQKNRLRQRSLTN